MRVLNRPLGMLALALVVLPLAAVGQTLDVDQAIDRIIAREHELNQNLRSYTPLVETYIQNLRLDDELGKVPASDRYFLGKADLRNGVRLQLLTPKSGTRRSAWGALKDWLLLEYEPGGFLQMIFLDAEHLDRQYYRFAYMGREFLGEVRCLIFDLTPQLRSGKGRFLGRIWVEDQDYTIVRFNGVYTGKNLTSFYFHFDSWRANAGPNLWLPTAIYSEEGSVRYGLGQRLRFKSQTRLWGYSFARPGQREQELGSIWVESPTPVRDETETSNDYSPYQAQRAWDQQAEQNVLRRLESLGLLAPPGEVDKVLETVLNNLAVTNNLVLDPEVRCRVLLTTTLESFTVGRSIILSRGLLDVLPDESTLATVLGHELGHILLGHQIDSQYGFMDRMMFRDHETFRIFAFARTPAEERAANQKAAELLAQSPYKDSLRNAALFALALDARAKQIPNLISAHLGDRVSAVFGPGNPAVVPLAQREGQVSALPLGSRIKLDPWSGGVQLLKIRPPASLSEREKMPFEVTPVKLYLTRPSAVPTASSERSVTAEPR